MAPARSLILRIALDKCYPHRRHGPDTGGVGVIVTLRRGGRSRALKQRTSANPPGAVLMTLLWTSYRHGPPSFTVLGVMSITRSQLSRCNQSASEPRTYIPIATIQPLSLPKQRADARARTRVERGQNQAAP